MEFSIGTQLPDVQTEVQKLQAELQKLTQQSQPTEALTPDELGIHEFFQQRVDHAIAAQQAWYEYLGQKYNLRPGDEITPQGWIHRHHPPQELG